MNTFEDFLALVRDELGLPVSAADADRDLTDVLGWDSMHLLSLVTVLERHTGRSVSVIDLLEARNLLSIYAVAAGTPAVGS